MKQLPSEQRQEALRQTLCGSLDEFPYKAQGQEKKSYTLRIRVCGELTLYTGRVTCAGGAHSHSIGCGKALSRSNTSSLTLSYIFTLIFPFVCVCVCLCVTARITEHLIISQRKVKATFAVNTLQFDAMLQSAGQRKHTSMTVLDTLRQKQQHLALCTALISCCMTWLEQFNETFGRF